MMASVYYSAGKLILGFILLLVLGACGDASDGSSGNSESGSVSGSKAKIIKMNGAIYSLADQRLVRVDISNPSNPTVTDDVDAGWSAETLTHDGEAIYVGSPREVRTYGYHPDTGLQFIDTSLPRRATSDPVITDGEYAYSTVVTRTGTDTEGNVWGEGDLYVYEVDAEKNLTEINVMTDIGFVQGLTLWNDNLLICDPVSGLLQLNVTDPMLIETVHQMDFVQCEDILHLGEGHFATVGEQGIYQLVPYEESKLAVISIYN